MPSAGPRKRAPVRRVMAVAGVDPCQTESFRRAVGSRGPENTWHACGPVHPSSRWVAGSGDSPAQTWPRPSPAQTNPHPVSRLWQRSVRRESVHGRGSLGSLSSLRGSSPVQCGCVGGRDWEAGWSGSALRPTPRHTPNKKGMQPASDNRNILTVRVPYHSGMPGCIPRGMVFGFMAGANPLQTACRRATPPGSHQKVPLSHDDHWYMVNINPQRA